jgi:translation elongation factor EF-4
MNEPIDTLSFMVHKDRAVAFGREICLKLRDKIPP